MATRTGGIVRLAAVRLMALSALLVAFGRALVFVLVAALALFFEGAAVGFVAILAIGVASVGFPMLLLVAGLAIDFESCGAVR